MFILQNLAAGGTNFVMSLVIILIKGTEIEALLIQIIVNASRYEFVEKN